MGQLTASIAHEINQPIAAVVSNAQAALRWLDMQPPNSQEVRKSLARIVKDGRRASDVISRIRALVRKAPARKERLDINDTIREIIALTGSELRRYGSSLRTQLADGLPLVPGDRVQLQQVMVNLIVNAIEAMSGVGAGMRELTISLRKPPLTTCLSKFGTRVPGSVARTSTDCFNPSTRPSPMGWAWGWRSAARSSRPMAGGCRHGPINLAALSFALRFRSERQTPQTSNAGGADRRRCITQPQSAIRGWDGSGVGMV
jgi:hypothetical protein